MPRWDEKTMADLCLALYGAVQPSITKEQQVEVVASMNEKGHDVKNWDTIR